MALVSGQIDPSARISPKVEMGRGVCIGPNSIVSDGVRVGNEVSIGANVVIEANVLVGDKVSIDHNCIVRQGTAIAGGTVLSASSVVGQRPSRAKTSTLAVQEQLPPLVVGAGCHIGIGAVVYAGSELGPGCFVADSAQVRERCLLGSNVIVGRNATVENDCRIGDRTRIQTGAYLTAHSCLAEDVFIAPMVTTSNDNYVARSVERFRHRKGLTVEKGGRIGANAVTLPGVVVGQEALVAAGSVVTKDAPPYHVVMGVPARVVRRVPSEQLIYPAKTVEGEPDHDTRHNS